MRAQETPIVVGVDATDDGERALRYAILEASCRSRPLRVVHAVSLAGTFIPMEPPTTGYPPSVLETATHLMDSAVNQAEKVGGPDLVVDRVMAHGARRKVLLEHAADAFELVLGRRHSTLARVATGSTTTSVAAHSPCRVVSVPTQWNPEVRHGRVVAGIDGSPASPAVFTAAFEAASVRGATLTLLCAWRPQGMYDAAIGAYVPAEKWIRDVQRQIGAASAGARAVHPDVPVATVAEYEPTATALTDATRNADLMVIGRTGHRAPFGLPLGSNAFTLMRTAACPLEIVPTGRRGE